MTDFLIPSDIKNTNNNKTKTSIYIIDSRERDLDKYPEPSNYQINLEREYNDIESIELLSYSLPNYIYNINCNNNLLHFSINDKNYILECDVGIYSEVEDLVNNIEKHLKKITKKIKIKYNKIKHKIIFISLDIETVFSLNFKNRNNLYPENSIAPILGFKPIDYNMIYDYDIYPVSIYDHNDKCFSYLIETNINLDSVLIDYEGYLIDIKNNIHKIKKVIHKKEEHNCQSMKLSFLIYLENKINTYPNMCQLFINKIESTNIVDLLYDKYILLEIPNGSRYNNNNKNLKDCFIEIPLINNIPIPSNNIIGVKKKFNPKISLKELKIQFYRYEKKNYPKKLFNFYGGEHVLVFAINYSIQSNKYNYKLCYN